MAQRNSIVTTWYERYTNPPEMRVTPSVTHVKLCVKRYVPIGSSRGADISPWLTGFDARIMSVPKKMKGHLYIPRFPARDKHSVLMAEDNGPDWGGLFKHFTRMCVYRTLQIDRDISTDSLIRAVKAKERLLQSFAGLLGVLNTDGAVSKHGRDHGRGWKGYVPIGSIRWKVKDPDAAKARLWKHKMTPIPPEGLAAIRRRRTRYRLLERKAGKQFGGYYAAPTSTV